MFQVQKRMCASCIYRPESPLDLAQLEAEIADQECSGFFRSYRICHHAKNTDVCCRGFWNAHKDDFSMGQIAQRMGWVEYVDVDTI